MRFKKGTKVEVQSQKDMPSGSWRCAEIIDGNGKNYTVRYYGHLGEADETTMERVSRNVIRPCPPALEVSHSLFLGDVVEVLVNFSWKMATVSRVLGKTNYLVRLLGSSLELKVSKFDIRMRQSWQNNKWIVIGKGYGNFEDGKHNDIVTLAKNPNLSARVQKAKARATSHTKDDHFHNNNEVTFEENKVALRKSLKRSPPHYSQAEPLAEATQKFRAIEQERRLYRLACITQPTLHANVEAVAFPREMLDEKCILSSFDKRTTGFSEVDPATRNPTSTVGCSFPVKSNDDDSITCSVGSCSMTSNRFYKFPRHEFAGFTEDVDVLSSDAESSCHLGNEEGNPLLPTNKEVAAEIHRLELHAYRCTIEALHATGPLSWEQEELVTDLRLSLHISNDEHLMEVRNLISVGNIIPSG